MKKICFALFLLAPLVIAAPSFAENPTISVNSPNVIQGEPLMIQVENVGGIDNVARILFNGKSLWFFTFGGKPTALVAIDLNQNPGQYKITAKLENSETIEKNVTVTAREKITEPLGIPEKLGGNTPQAAANLVASLTKENAVINGVKSAPKRFWTEKFIYPLANPVVTDGYGYLRKTGYYTIPHKGTDFKAAEGTPILAMNRGVVRLVNQSAIYGKTIVVDHGLGVVTYYMHLSKIYVAPGRLVKKGEVIGLSGQTGYAEVPHLHLSVKLGGVSIDPIGFMNLFKTD
jgi:murein DD-endopeptidase MepM/ murein hydrolase activator NlpD